MGSLKETIAFLNQLVGEVRDLEISRCEHVLLPSFQLLDFWYVTQILQAWDRLPRVFGAFEITV